jgi:hypothetical protein
MGMVLSGGGASGSNVILPVFHPIMAKKLYSPDESGLFAWTIFPISRYISPFSFPLKDNLPVFFPINKGLRISKSFTWDRSPRNISGIKTSD